jgi:hypothetical protein
MTPLSFLPDSSRACSLTRALLKLAASVVSREPSALELMAMGLPVEPLNRKQSDVWRPVTAKYSTVTETF